MTRITTVFLCAVLCVIAASVSFAYDVATSTEKLILDSEGRPLCGDYLGQEPPGQIPVLFAPGVVSTDLGMYGTVVFTSDHSEAYWVADESPDMWWSKRVNDCWIEPRILPLLDNHRINSPVLSVDDQRLYFLAAEHGIGGHDENDRIWVAERTADGWAEPQCLGEAVNGTSKHFQFSVDAVGNVYFGGGKGGDVHVARRTTDGYHPARPVGAPIDSDDPDVDPCISPDGTCLIFTRFLSSPPGAFLFASFRQPSGDWTEPVMLNDVLDSQNNDSGARFSPDGRYFFFQSCRPGSEPNRSVYWVDAKILEPLNAASR